jgi:hypothetical protein
MDVRYRSSFRDPPPALGNSFIRQITRTPMSQSFANAQKLQSLDQPSLDGFISAALGARMLFAFATKRHAYRIADNERPERRITKLRFGLLSGSRRARQFCGSLRRQKCWSKGVPGQCDCTHAAQKFPRELRRGRELSRRCSGLWRRSSRCYGAIVSSTIRGTRHGHRRGGCP